MEIAQEIRSVRGYKAVMIVVCAGLMALGTMAAVELATYYGRIAAQDLSMWIVKSTLGGRDVVVDHKKVVVENAAKLSREQLEKELYFSLVQLNAQAETLRDLEQRLELDKNMGAKIIKWNEQ